MASQSSTKKNKNTVQKTGSALGAILFFLLTLAGLVAGPASADDAAPEVPSTDISLTQDIHRGSVSQGTLNTTGTQGTFKADATDGTKRVSDVAKLPGKVKCDPDWGGDSEASQCIISRFTGDQ